MIEGLAFAIAMLFAGVMGLAIQRGATCTVAAVDEWVHRGSLRRLSAMIEAAAWVGGGLFLLKALHGIPALPGSSPPGPATIAGALLLGLGAYVNRACVFGAVARFGGGEWAYAATPAGFYLGCLAAGTLLARWSPAGAVRTSVALTAPVKFAWIAVALLGVRFATMLWRRRRASGIPLACLMNETWSPHVATLVIGLAFLAMLTLVGAWGWTEAVADLARGATAGLAPRLLLAAGLLLGAVVGASRAGRWRPVPITRGALARCTVGGVLMGLGSVLIPGSNDGLILVGMPLLQPSAWLAFVVMAVTIASAIHVERRLRAAE